MKKLLFLFISLFLTAGSVLAQTVVLCNGKYATKYHSSSSCKGLNNCKGGLSQVSVKKAAGMGRGPCSICNPPAVSNNSQNAQPAPSEENVQPVKKQSQSVQCSATTKKGTRCSRMTISSNGLCWQHGGN